MWGDGLPRSLEEAFLLGAEPENIRHLCHLATQVTERGPRFPQLSALLGEVREKVVAYCTQGDLDVADKGQIASLLSGATFQDVVVMTDGDLDLLSHFYELAQDESQGPLANFLSSMPQHLAGWVVTFTEEAVSRFGLSSNRFTTRYNEPLSQMVRRVAGEENYLKYFVHTNMSQGPGASSDDQLLAFVE